MSRPHLWIRAEHRPTEQRAPLIPEDVATLVEQGYTVTIEESDNRILPLQDYLDAGASSAPAGSWTQAPDDVVVLGIKELPVEPEALRHTHVFFAHAYKGQEGAEETLARFERGAGELLDVEYLTVDGRRVVAFGYWAGYVGAALAVLQHRGELQTPVTPMAKADLDTRLAETATEGATEKALVIGARGRSGRGAADALLQAGCAVTAWDRESTVALDKEALLDHDLLVNCIVAHAPGEPFVAPEDLDRPRRLRTVGDVTCDVTSDANRLPVNTAITTWDEPVRELGTPEHPLTVVAIDNLPSLLPAEASTSFSAELMPIMDELGERSGPWAASLEWFRKFVPGRSGEQA